MKAEGGDVQPVFEPVVQRPGPADLNHHRVGQATRSRRGRPNGVFPLTERRCLLRTDPSGEKKQTNQKQTDTGVMEADVQSHTV